MHQKVSDALPADDFEILANNFTPCTQWDGCMLYCKDTVCVATRDANTIQRINRDGEAAIMA